MQAYIVGGEGLAKNPQGEQSVLQNLDALVGCVEGVTPSAAPYLLPLLTPALRVSIDLLSRPQIAPSSVVLWSRLVLGAFFVAFIIFRCFCSVFNVAYIFVMIFFLNNYQSIISINLAHFFKA